MHWITLQSKQTSGGDEDMVSLFGALGQALIESFVVVLVGAQRDDDVPAVGTVAVQVVGVPEWPVADDLVDREGREHLSAMGADDPQDGIGLVVPGGGAVDHVAGAAEGLGDCFEDQVRVIWSESFWHSSASSLA